MATDNTLWDQNRNFPDFFFNAVHRSLKFLQHLISCHVTQALGGDPGESVVKLYLFFFFFQKHSLLKNVFRITYTSFKYKSEKAALKQLLLLQGVDK